MKEKGKWTPHIIAVSALVVFIALGFGSATGTPLTEEEREAQRVAAQQALIDAGNGRLGYRNTEYKSAAEGFIFFVDPENRRTVYYLYQSIYPQPIKGDTSYTIRYRRARGNENSNDAQREDKSHWSTKTIYVPIGETVYVDLP